MLHATLSAMPVENPFQDPLRFERRGPECVVVIFGANGDLTKRKLIPALYSLHQKGRLLKGTRIVGVARTKFSDEAWRDELAASTQKFIGKSFETPVHQPLLADSYSPKVRGTVFAFNGFATNLGQIAGPMFVAVAFGPDGSSWFEGMLPVRRMPGDWWELNEEQTMLVGSRTGRTLRLGDAVTVRVGRIDVPRGRVDLYPDSDE